VVLSNERPRGKPRGIPERNPQELRSKLRGILIPQMRDKPARENIHSAQEIIRQDLWDGQDY
jgi:hypothetical protein